MARKDLPYLPLYVQDFLTDEKLNECSASSVGVYIKIMCVLHKCSPYGKILLKQKDKQTNNQIEDFALKFVRHLPYPFATILSALNELIEEEVLTINNNVLYQKRMVEDSELSIKRSKSGKLGGSETQKINKNFAKANVEANTDNEIDIDNEVTKINKEGICQKMIFSFKKVFPEYYSDEQTDLPATFKIAQHIAKQKGWPESSITNGKMESIILEWENIIDFTKGHSLYSNFSIQDLEKKWTGVIQSKATAKVKTNTKSKFNMNEIL